MMHFCRRFEGPVRVPTLQESYLRAHGRLPFSAAEDLRVALPARLDQAPDRAQRIRIILGALVQGLDPRWIRARLADWEVHPISVILAAPEARQRAQLEAVLMPGQGEWTVGMTTIFRGSELPPGLHLPGPLTLESCAGLVALPQDLETPSLILLNCRDLESLSTLPPGVGGLVVENAPRLTQLPRRLYLEHGLLLTACPALESLPSVIGTSHLLVRHCPGLRTITAKVSCVSLTLESLINLSELTLDLQMSDSLDLRLASLRELRGRLQVGGRLRIACPNLRSVTAEIRAEASVVVELCRELQTLSGLFRVKGGLRIQRNPKLEATPSGSVTGSLDLLELPALRRVEGSLISACRKVRIRHCGALEHLPEGIQGLGSMELLDLPALRAWPEALSLRGLTILGCPELPDLATGIKVQGHLRRAGLPEREALARALLEDLPIQQLRLESLRRVARILKAAGLPLEEVLRLLQSDGHAPGDALVAAAAEGLGLREFLGQCVRFLTKPGGEVQAALACSGAAAHPLKLVPLVKDRTMARWLTELYGDLPV